MCDVPSIAVFCNESIERFPGTASKFFLKLIIIIIIIIIIIQNLLLIHAGLQVINDCIKQCHVLTEFNHVV
jgi:hypothetical protein